MDSTLLVNVTLPRREWVCSNVKEKGEGEQSKPWLSRRENAKPRREIHS